jgi:hypothetical protein
MNIKALFLLLLLPLGLSAQKILVFLPGNVSDKKIQTEISKQISGNIQVVDKINDLEKSIKDDPNQIVIAPGAFVQYTKGYSTILQGHDGATTGTKYLLVSAKTSVTSDNISNAKIGIWNVFGRKNIEPFFKDYFGVNISKTKKVNKNEDLLTLLGLDMVDAILISEADLTVLKKNTDIKLNIIAESKKSVPFPVVAIPAGSSIEVSTLEKTPKSFLMQFSFQGWRAK